MIDIIIWIALAGFMMFAFYRYIITPDKCPYCKTRMIRKSQTMNGKIVNIKQCPFCEYEIILED